MVQLGIGAMPRPKSKQPTHKWLGRDWWPKQNDGNYIRRFYRVMRTDGDDLNREVHPIMQEEHGSDKFMWYVLDALRYGSLRGYRSPFWHASTSLAAARNWRCMGDSRKRTGNNWRHQEDTGNGRKRIAIEIDAWAWWESGSMPENALIDLSSDHARKKNSRSPWVVMGSIRPRRWRLWSGQIKPRRS